MIATSREHSSGPCGEQDAMRRTYRAVTVLAVAAATLTAGAASAAAAVGAVGQPGKVAQAGKVTLHSTRVIYGPRAMVTGPDGALWYTNSIGNSIGRITTSGHVKSAFHAPQHQAPVGDRGRARRGAVVHQLPRRL